MIKQTSIKQIARQRIQILFSQAKKVNRTNPELSTQYISLAKRIAMAAKIRLPLEFRRQTCKKCSSLFMFSFNCRVRVKPKREPHVVITCLNCGDQTRILLRKKRQTRIE